MIYKTNDQIPTKVNIELDESFEQIANAVMEMYKSSMELSAEEINAIKSSQVVTEAVITEASKSMAESFGKALGKLFIGTNNIFNLVNNTATEIGKVIKKEGLNKRSRQKIDIIIKDLYSTVSNNLIVSDYAYTKFKNYNPNKIKNSLVLVAMAVIINSVFQLVALILFGPIIGAVLTNIICAPLVEESCKRVAVTGGYAKEFAIVFNSIEFSLYVAPTIGTEIFAQAVVVRMAPVAMHLVTIIIQFLTSNEKVKKAMKLEKEEDKAKLENIGFTTGILIHSLWNSLATMMMFTS